MVYNEIVEIPITNSDDHLKRELGTINEEKGIASSLCGSVDCCH